MTAETTTKITKISTPRKLPAIRYLICNIYALCKCGLSLLTEFIDSNYQKARYTESRVYNRKEGEYPTHYSTMYHPFTGVSDLSSIIHNLWFHTTPLTTTYVAVHKTAASATRLNTCRTTMIAM